MKDIVIVGAGPIGLYTAIRLKQKGVTNVTVIDPRANNYSRPGDIDPENFIQVGKDLGHEIEFSSSRHIKDMERSLYKIATEEYGITIQRNKFDSFAPDSLVVTDGEGNKSSIPCDLALDATGSRRVLVHEVNKQVSEKPFTVERAAENPITNFFIAYVKIKNSDIVQLQNPSQSAQEPVGHTFALERLRTEFGWPEFNEPYFRTRAMGKDKVCLYLETPPNLPPNQQEQWLQALLELKTGKNDITFQRIQPRLSDEPTASVAKPIFIPFKVDPHLVKELSFPGNATIPEVLPIGDAQIDPDARLRIGIDSGTNRVKALLEAITVTKGEVSIDDAKYREAITPAFDDHKRKLGELYEERTTQLKNSLDQEKTRYFNALKAVSGSYQTQFDDNDFAVISEGLADLADRYIEIGDDLFMSGNIDESQKYYVSAFSILQSPTFYSEEASLNLLFEISPNGMDEISEARYKEILKAMLSQSPEMLTPEVLDKIDEQKAIQLNHSDIIDMINFAKPSLIKYTALQEILQFAKEEQTADASTQNTVLNHALLAAIAVSDYAEINSLGAAHANLNQTDDKGFTLLHQMIRDDNKRMARTLLQLGANPNIPNKEGKLPIETAEKNNDTFMKEHLLQNGAKPTPEMQERDRVEKLNDQLYWAIADNEVEETKQLLNEGVSPNFTKDGKSPITMIVTQGNAELLELVLQKGGNPNLKEFSGRTPLMEAAMEGNIPIIEILLANGADTTLKDKRGNSFLEYADPGQVEDIKQLIEKQAVAKPQTVPTKEASVGKFGLFAKPDKSPQPASVEAELSGKKPGNN